MRRILTVAVLCGGGCVSRVAQCRADRVQVHGPRSRRAGQRFKGPLAMNNPGQIVGGSRLAGNWTEDP